MSGTVLTPEGAAAMERLVSQGRAADPDFDKKTATVMGLGGFDRLNELREVLAELPDAHRVITALADGNAAETSRILRLSRVQLATELGRLSVRRAAPPSAKPAAAATKPATTTSTTPAKFDPRAFIAERNAADRERRGIPPPSTRDVAAEQRAAERARIKVVSSQWTLPRSGRSGTVRGSGDQVAVRRSRGVHMDSR